MKNDVNLMIFDIDQFNRAGHFYADKMVNDHTWRAKMYKKHTYYTKRFFTAGEQFRKLTFAEMTNQQLLREVNKLILLQKQVRILGVMLNGLVLDGRNHLSTMIRDELRNHIPDSRNFEQSWSILTQVTTPSLRQKKDIAIARLALRVQQKYPTDAEKGLRKIYKQYCWLDYMYYGPPAPFNSFQEDFQRARKQNKNFGLTGSLAKTAQRQQKLMQRLRFDTRAKRLVWLAKYILLQKGWRKDVEYHSFYCYEPFFRELARRKGIKDWRNILYLLPWELEGFILQKKPKISELKKRRLFSCLIVDGTKPIRMLTGKKARAFYTKLGIERKTSRVKHIEGQCAYPGKVRGEVRVINSPVSMKKMKQGAVLVSQATSPDLLPAMKQAAAIVTSTGGLICHAAITARELKIPCVVGTKIVTEVLKDGDLVEVDATKGVVRKI
ncbi:hypothetical protein IID19_03945 [Patescibacteria group bacterium]|nr:hypothetical protein [Patescibacteria group bacterium]